MDLENTIKNTYHIFLYYKINKCHNINCNNNYPKNNYKCFNYHTEKDKRRFPFKVCDIRNLNDRIWTELYIKYLNSSKNKIDNLNWEWEYDMKYNWNTNEKSFIKPSNLNSLNALESRYHLKNFKNRKCQNDACKNNYCFKFHFILEKKVILFLKELLKNNNDNSLKEISNNNIFNTINLFDSKNKNNNSSSSCNINKNFKNNNNIELIEFRPNHNNSRKYFYEENINFNKNKNIIFFNSLDLKLTTNAICALLNCNGGKIYFGLKNNIVKGIKLNRKDIDVFQNNLDNNLRYFNNGIFINLMKMNFYEICGNETYTNVINNYFIIRISIKNPIGNRIYFTNENLLCIYKEKKVNILLNNKEVINFIKIKYILNKVKNDLDLENTLLLIKKIDLLWFN